MLKQTEVESLPENPGCYLFKDSQGEVIYIGKAQNLRKRVQSYLQKNQQSVKTAALVHNIHSVDYIVTDSEVEALLLENNLVKKQLPKYNIKLKDASRYALIHITADKYPRLLVARKPKGKGSFYGPFVSAISRDHVLNTLRRIFQVRTCKRLPKRACLRYHIELCGAPCEGKISKENYLENIQAAEMVLKGKTKELLGGMEQQMKEASVQLNFEHALQLRNQIGAIQRLSEKQTMERQKSYDEDIINYQERDGRVYLILFNVHRGLLENKKEFDFEFEEDFLERFLVQFYSENKVPRELILPEELDESLLDFLKHRRDGAVTVTVPKRGEKKQLLALVAKNIELSFFGDLNALEELRKALEIQSTPTVMECFDISHLSGTLTVGSMVQFRNGRPDKSNYRRFKLKTMELGEIDDFKAIAEVVRRRYTRLRDEGEDMPDLIVIDGGKGQLKAALEQLKELGLRLPVISLAKRLEEIYLPGIVLPLTLNEKSKPLHLLQRLRDEAHRFAIKYNRLLREKNLRE